MMKIPSTSPDLNPIENTRKVLDDRMNETAPRGFESVPHFKTRAQKAVAWVNKKKMAALQNTVRSMPRRLKAVLDKKGAMTKY